MDPTEALRLFVDAMDSADQAYAEARKAEDKGDFSDAADAYARADDFRAAAADHADDLIGWLAKGGCPPDWAEYKDRSVA